MIMSAIEIRPTSTSSPRRPPEPIGASLFTDFGGSVSLALIKDANNNGVVDKNELLASATLASSGAKELTKSISAGNYFLRVTSNDIDGTVAKYFLDFQTDYAGSTPKTGAKRRHARGHEELRRLGQRPIHRRNQRHRRSLQV